MLATRCVDQNDFSMTFGGVLDGIERHRSGVGAFLLPDNADAESLAVHLELLDGAGPEGVRCGNDHTMALL